MNRKTTVTTNPATQSDVIPLPNARRQKAGRAPDVVRLRSSVRLGFPTLRRWHKLLTQAVASPRSASTALALTDMAADITALLGGAIAPDYVPPVRQTTVGYVVTHPDGTEEEFKLGVKAAERLGITVGSLRAMLSKHGGAYERTYPSGQGMETWKVRRLTEPA